MHYKIVHIHMLLYVKINIKFFFGCTTMSIAIYSLSTSSSGFL